MLPKQALTLFRSLLRFANLQHVFPYSWKWNGRANKYKVRGGRRTKVMYWARLQFIWLYELFLVRSAWTIVTHPTLTMGQKFQPLYRIFTFLAFNMGMLTTLSHSDKLPSLINNGVLGATMDFRGSGDAEGKTSQRSVLSETRSMLVVTGPITLLVVLTAMAAFKIPAAPIFLTSLLPEPTRCGVALRLASTIVHGYLYATQYFEVCLHTVVLVSYVDAMKPRIEALRLTKVGNRRKWYAVKYERLMLEYINLSVIGKLFNNCYGNWALVIQIYYTASITGNIFSAVVFSNLRSAYVALLLSYVAAVIFKRFGQLFETSVDTLDSWKSIRGPLWFRKFRACCQPLRVTVGSFYYADCGLVLTMLSIIVDNSVTMIVTYADV